MRCICENCKYRAEHSDGLVCSRKIIFVDRDHTCTDWDTEEVATPKNLIVFTIVILALAIFLSKIL